MMRIALPCFFKNARTSLTSFAFRTNESAVKSIVDDTLRDLEKSGEAEKIYFQWYGPKTKIKFTTRPFKFESDKIDG